MDPTIAQALEAIVAQLDALDAHREANKVALQLRLDNVEASIQRQSEKDESFRIDPHNRAIRRLNFQNQPPLQNNRANNGRGSYRHENDYRDPYDPDERVIRNVKIDAPSFEGQLEPALFLDWLAAMDRYFELYDMSEPRKVRFAKIKLLGQAQLYWNNVERQLDRLNQEPITLWEEMKAKLKEKYLPVSYRSKLMDQWQTLRQGSKSVAEYIAKFDNFMLRCDVQEDTGVTLSRFRTGLRKELQRELRLRQVNYLEQAIQQVQELEQYHKPNFQKRFDPRDATNRPNVSGNKPLFGNQTTRMEQPTRFTANEKNKGLVSEMTKIAHDQYYKCKGFGHFASQCPNKNSPKNLVIEDSETLEEEEANEDLYEFDCDEEFYGELDEYLACIRNITPIIEHEDTIFTPPLIVVRCALAQPKKEDDWRRNTIFYTFVKQGDKVCKIIIDSGNYINVVASNTITKFGLKSIPHPRPYEVSWTDKTAIKITQQCLVPI